MKILVVFDFPAIYDLDGPEADHMVNLLEVDLKNSFGTMPTRLSSDPNSECSWYIENALD